MFLPPLLSPRVDPPPVLAVLILSLATMLLAAKAHGRQLRLEREQMGIHHVEFGGTNPPEVEALWRRDRRRFWPTTAVAFLALAAWAYAADLGAPAPALWRSDPTFGGSLLVLPLWAMTVGFVATGLRSLAALRDAAGRRASYAWWGGVAAACALVVGLAG